MVPGKTFAQKERALGAVHYKNEGVLLQLLGYGFALKVWFLHAQYMKMTRDERVLGFGFESCDISIY